MIERNCYIRQLRLRDESAIQKARAHYLTIPELTFEDDLLWYFKCGWVYSSPTCFVMGCLINIAPEDTNLVQPAWFIRYATGNLIEIMMRLPFELEYIVWCRDNQDGGSTLRRYKTKRLYALAGKLKLRGTRAESGIGAQVANAGSTPAHAAAQIGGA